MCSLPPVLVKFYIIYISCQDYQLDRHREDASRTFQGWPACTIYLFTGILSARLIYLGSEAISRYMLEGFILSSILN